MARLRTFIGVDIGKAIRDRAAALQEKLAQSTSAVKWVEHDNLHVTLFFLGEVEDREVPTVCRAVAEQVQKHAAFELGIERVGCFPNPRRPRVLWIGVGQGTQELCALHEGLEPPLLDLGCYRREERKYTPHITLGRVRGDRPDDALGAALAKHAGWHCGQTLVNEILVMSSELTPRGPIYTVLSRAKLG
jgi:RNA 2',3'-cyclic 3'-phosphodiesterase